MVNMDSQQILIPLLLIGATAFFMGVYGTKRETLENPFKARNILEQGLTMPTIWLYYDSSDVNSRWWADFGARSTRVLNLPFLNLCYQSIVNANKANYKVEIVSGLTGVAERLGGWHKMPVSLRNPLATVREAELNWIRAAILARFGGLWVHPATICLRPFPVIPHEKVVFFGTDPDESYTGSGGTAVPSMYVMGAGKKEHPVFVQWADAAYNRLEKIGGGTQIRGDAKWDFTAYAATSSDVECYPNLEISRKPDGKRVQIEDLLSAGQEGYFRFKVEKDQLYVPIPWPELRDRRLFGWFLRMSEDQILDSDLVISDLFRATQQ